MSTVPAHESHSDQLMAQTLGVCWHSPTSTYWPCPTLADWEIELLREQANLPDDAPLVTTTDRTGADTADVERVARAIYEADIDVDTDSWPWTGTGDDTRDQYRDMARAAIAELAAPGTVSSGQDCARCDGTGCESDDSADERSYPCQACNGSGVRPASGNDIPDPDWLYNEESRVLYGPDPDHPRLRYPWATLVEPEFGHALAAGMNRGGQAVQRVLDLADELETGTRPRLMGFAYDQMANRIRDAVAGPQRDHDEQP